MDDSVSKDFSIYPDTHPQVRVLEVRSIILNNIGGVTLLHYGYLLYDLLQICVNRYLLDSKDLPGILVDSLVDRAIASLAQLVQNVKDLFWLPCQGGFVQLHLFPKITDKK